MSTKTASNPPAAATSEVDADSIVRLLDSGKIDTDTVFQRVADGVFTQAVAAAAVRQHMLNAAAAAAAEAAKNAKPVRRLSLKVSEKGCISLYGVRVPYPISFYAGEWETILAMAEEIRQFAKDNASKLSRK